MFCPSCGGEYVEGVLRCADCDVDLVSAPPPATEHVSVGDLVTVFGTGDPVLLMTAKTLLEQAGIPYLSRGEGTQDLFGMGRLGTGFNLVAGPMELQVPSELWQEAAEVLRQAKLEQLEAGSDEEEEGWEDG